MRRSILSLLIGFVGWVALCEGALTYAGVNQAGAEFDSGTYWPTTASADYFISKGFNTLRYCLKWERLQTSLLGPLDTTYLNEMNTFIDHATTAGAFVIIDIHNYARYNGQAIGSGLSDASLADLWTRLANQYKSNDKVIFGIMNEPNSMATEDWLSGANAAIAAIRATAATNLILVPGNAWTGGHSWAQNWYGTPNADVMTGIVDSGNNFAVEIHQYLDPGYDGTGDPSCIAEDTGVTTLTGVTAWAVTNNFRLFLGEFAGGDNTQCSIAVDNMLTYMEENSVWIGYTWWAAGPSWPSNYIFDLEYNGNDRPQLAWLLPHLGDGVIGGGGSSSGGGGGSSSSASSSSAGPMVDSEDVYVDALVSGWSDFSWATDYSLAEATIKRGSFSIRFVPQSFQAIYLHCNNGCFNTNDFTFLQFYVHGGTSGGQTLRVKLRKNEAEIGDEVLVQNIAADEWAEVNIAMSSFNVPGSDNLDGFTIQDHLGSVQGTVYLDDITIISPTTPGESSGSNVSADGDADVSADGDADTSSSSRLFMFASFLEGK